MNYKQLAVVLGASTILAACTAPEDPQGTVCQQMAEVLTKRSHIDWETPAHTDQDNLLQVDLFSPDLNARCLFHREVDPTDGGELLKVMPYETVPFEMYINGNQVPEADMIKASFTATGMQFEKSVRDTDRAIQEKAQQAEEAARNVSKELMDKTQELNR